MRRILDEAGFPEVPIVASGGLDEFQLEELSSANAPYNLYGVGTSMGVSGDAPWTDMAYKLVNYAARPVLKLSTNKVSLPGLKQLYRFAGDPQISGQEGQVGVERDVIALRDEVVQGAEPLLEVAMVDGRTVGEPPTLREIRERFRSEFSLLAEQYKAIRAPETYPVTLSPGLRALRRDLESRLAEAERTRTEAKDE